MMGGPTQKKLIACLIIALVLFYYNNRKRGTMYKVIRWQTDGTEEIWEAPQKPTFQEMYKLINCTTIERQSGYDKDISNRTFDMWCDEESKMKGDEFIKKNIRATNAWFRWMKRTGHMCMPGDFIAGNTIIYKKI
jgi:hypothetical protein